MVEIMTSGVKEYPYIIDTLEAYPRVNRLFKRDFIDLNRRFKTVIRRHTITKNPELEKELDNLEGILKRPIKVIVVGKCGLELNEIVESHEHLSCRAEQIDLQEADTGLTFVVCNAKIDDVETGLQEVSAVINHCHTDKTLPAANNIYLVCQTEESATQDKIDMIRCEALEQMKSLRNQNNLSDHIIVGPVGQSICKKIGNNLESRIIRAFANVRNFLKTFIKLKRSISLENDRALYDLVYRTIENVRLQSDDCKSLQVLEFILSKTASSVKQSLSEWYRLPPDVCSRVFEDEWNQYFKQTGLMQGWENDRKIKLSFTMACNNVKQCVRTFTEELDRRLILVGNIALTMRKMIFEIDAYIRKSDLSSEYLENSLTTAVIPHGLQKELCAIDDRISVAPYLDALDINIDTSSKIENVNSKIAVCLKKYNFEGAFRVNYTTNRKCGSTISYTNAIWTKEEIYGTIGLIVRGCKVPYEANSYALTTYHCLAGVDGLHESTVFTKTKDETVLVLGKTAPDLVAHMDSSGNHLIDIAAIQIDKCNERYVDTSVLDEDGDLKIPEIASNCLENLVGTKVYKYGVGSTITHGMICSFDYFSSFGGGNPTVIGISSLPGAEDPDYIRKGDSGSVNFRVNVDDPRYVTAISMNIGSLLNEFGDEQIYLSVLLEKGLQELSLRSGVDFSCYETPVIN